MIFYISHNFAAREWLLKGPVWDLEKMGHKVNARWLIVKSEAKSAAEKEQSAIDNYLDISACDYLIHFADQYGDRIGKGRFIEIGYAQAWGKRVIVIGALRESSVFYYYGRTQRFEYLTDAMIYIHTLPKETAA